MLEEALDASLEARDTPGAEPSIATMRRCGYGSGLLLLLALHFQEGAP
jgi:hypothetical protein